MPNIAVSYYHNGFDLEIAVSLKEKLEMVEGINFQCHLVPMIRDELVENAEKISNIFDHADFAIIIYTEESSEVNWVNQEIGYLYSLMKREGLRVLVLFENRDSFHGFIHSGKFNLSREFRIDRDELDSLVNEVEEYLVTEYKFPVQIHDEERHDYQRFHDRGNEHDAQITVYLENVTDKLIST